ncbi:MAG: hypothetical protein A2Y75_05400 [Candidatus Solincola sediminis]|uniref:Uncharacterized protein n=1 Tax=Candidatus Solincola sediminis TaxID=1797199 RepID=A0A1F2WG95_9ACTN|nr:MAG: hypothetical protein A2Y75_05400 [Candidatus Solincola sediminis]
MVATCVSAVKGRVVRVVTLDACGNPVTGASSSQVVTRGFISVKSTPQYEDGAEYTQKQADGSLCVSDKDPAQLKRVALEAVFCVLDPDLIVIAAGARLLNSGTATGTGAAFNGSVNANRFSLEVWQDISGRGACNISGQQQYLYWAWPNVGNGQVSDYTIENGVSQFKLSAETASVGTLWGDGPGTTTWLGQVLLPGEHYAYNVTTTAPPTATCGATLLS